MVQTFVISNSDYLIDLIEFIAKNISGLRHHGMQIYVAKIVETWYSVKLQYVVLINDLIL